MDCSISGWGKIALTVAGLAAAALTSAAHAALILTPGNNPQAGSDNVVFELGCNAGAFGPANTVAGCFLGDATKQITFAAEENVAALVGTGTVGATDNGGYQTLRIAVTGGTFTSVVLNLDAVVDGSVTFSDGLTSLNAALSGNGQNFFTLTGGSFGFIDLTVPSDNVANVKNVRIGGVQGATSFAARSIPEPATAALLCMTLIGLAVARRSTGR